MAQGPYNREKYKLNTVQCICGGMKTEMSMVHVCVRVHMCGFIRVTSNNIWYSQI